eukprot:7386395-Prymnesium_polylepis.2
MRFFIEHDDNGARPHGGVPIVPSPLREYHNMGASPTCQFRLAYARVGLSLWQPRPEHVGLARYVCHPAWPPLNSPRRQMSSRPLPWTPRPVRWKS